MTAGLGSGPTLLPELGLTGGRGRTPLLPELGRGRTPLLPEDEGLAGSGRTPLLPEDEGLAGTAPLTGRARGRTPEASEVVSLSPPSVATRPVGREGSGSSGAMASSAPSSSSSRLAKGSSSSARSVNAGSSFDALGSGRSATPSKPESLMPAVLLLAWLSLASSSSSSSSSSPKSSSRSRSTNSSAGLVCLDGLAVGFSTLVFHSRARSG